MISPPNSQRLSTWRRMVFGESVEDARCSMKGRKQASSCSPGGRSCSSPIQESGQRSRLRQEAETVAATGTVARWRREALVFAIVGGMELVTILNHCHRQRGFVYQHARFGPDNKTIEVRVRPRQGTAAVCSGCHRPAPGYDHLPERRFEFIPFWGFLVFFLYRMRRVHCRNCGIVVEQVPWSDGKHQSTQAHMLFLARWARKLSWKETAESFHTSWDKVCDAVEYVVRWGLEHRTLESIRAIGVDEIQYAKGPQVPDAGLPDRRRNDAPALGRQGTHHPIFPGILYPHRRPTRCADPVCLFRHVEALSGCSPPEMLPGAAHPRSFSCRGQDEQGPGRGPCRRIAPDGAAGSRAAVEEISLVRAEAQTESHGPAEVPPPRSAPLQPANRPRLSAQGGLSTVLGIQLAHLGRHVPGLLVLPNHAQPHRADEKDRTHAARSPRASAELFQGQKGVFQRRGRGLEQQGQSHHEKILRLSHLPHPRTRSLSLTCQAA